jgi:hypothetical protein
VTVRVTTVTLIGKPDCHLCDVAREVVETVVAELPEDSVDVEELSIADDPSLYAQWWEKIPVVLIDRRRAARPLARVARPPARGSHPLRRPAGRTGPGVPRSSA